MSHNTETNKTEIMYKKILAVIAISALGLGTAFTQHGGQQFENKTPEEIAKLKTERMTDRLELTSDQTIKVHDVFLESATKRARIQEKYPQVKEAKEEMNAVRKATKAKVQLVLSPEQQAKAKEMHGSTDMKMKKGHGSEMSEASVDQRIKRMKESLDLTDSQVSELTQIFEQKQVQREEIQAKYPELAAAKNEMKQNREETQKQLEKVLTSAQLKMMNEHGHKNGKGCENGKNGKKGKR